MANYNRNQILELIRDGEYDRVEDIAAEVGATLTQTMSPTEVADIIVAAQAVRLVGNAGWRRPEFDDARGVFGRVKNWVLRFDEMLEDQPLLTQVVVAIISGLRFTTPEEVREILAEEGLEARLSKAAEDRMIARVMTRVEVAMAAQKEELLEAITEVAEQTPSTLDDNYIARLRKQAEEFKADMEKEYEQLISSITPFTESEPAEPKKKSGWRP